MSDLIALNRTAMLADDLWQAELVAMYGRNAGDARYDQRGKATLTLWRLCCDKRHADYAVACAWAASRGERPLPMAPLPPKPMGVAA